VSTGAGSGAGAAVTAGRLFAGRTGRAGCAGWTDADAEADAGARGASSGVFAAEGVVATDVVVITIPAAGDAGAPGSVRSARRTPKTPTTATINRAPPATTALIERGPGGAASTDATPCARDGCVDPVAARSPRTVADGAAPDAIGTVAAVPSSVVVSPAGGGADGSVAAFSPPRATSSALFMARAVAKRPSRSNARD